jgi:S1-C subfamily serine protease
MHCHEVWEGLRRRAKQNGEFDPSSLFVYPRPENIGLTLDVDAGNVVAGVEDNSVCDNSGIRSGDIISQIGDSRIYSQADVSWALHNAPETGQIPMHVFRNETKLAVSLTLEKHWKESKLSWRASMSKEDPPVRHNK